MSRAAIETRNLRKSYGPVEAVRGVDLEVRRGEVFGLLGTNGAGKTTVVEILEGHRMRSSGEVEVLGFDPATGGAEYRSKIGIVLQSTSVERYLTVAEVMEQFCGIYGNPIPSAEIIDMVGLNEKRNDRVSRLSGGQQRRLDVGIALAGDPELLFLDEPTTGFDPAARRDAWEMIRNLRSLGKTVLLTTHNMEEAQALSDRVAVLAGGRIVAEGSPEELADKLALGSQISFRLPMSAPPLPSPLSERFDIDGRFHKCETASPTPLLAELATWATAAQIELEAIQVHSATLEDAFLSLTDGSSATGSSGPGSSNTGDAT